MRGGRYFYGLTSGMNFKKLLAQSIIWRGVYFVTLFAVNVVLSRCLHADGTGKIYFLSNTLSLIQLLAGFCLEGSITYFSASGAIAANKILWLCMAWTLVVVIALSAGVLGIGNSVNVYFEELNAPVYGFYYIIGITLTNYGCCLFYAEGNFLKPNVVLAILNGLFCVVAVKMYYAYGNSRLITDVYFYAFLLQGAAVVITYFLSHKKAVQIALPSWPDVKKFFRYALQVLAANVLFFFVYRVDYYFVHASPVCSSIDLGNYMQVSKLGQMLIVLPQIIASAVYPQMSSGENRAAVSETVMLLARIMSAVYLLLIIGVAIGGGVVFPFVFGGTFNRMTVPMLLLLPGIFCVSVLVILASFFSGKGNVRVSVYAAFMALLVVLAGDYYFVPVYGIGAAALVSTVGYAVNLGYYLFQFKKDYGLSTRQFFTWRKSDLTLTKSWLLRR